MLFKNRAGSFTPYPALAWSKATEVNMLNVFGNGKKHGAKPSDTGCTGISVDMA
jgi:hypothetical protein